MNFLNTPEWYVGNQTTTEAIDLESAQSAMGNKTFVGPQVKFGAQCEVLLSGNVYRPHTAKHYYDDIGNVDNLSFAFLGIENDFANGTTLSQQRVCYNYLFTFKPTYSNEIAFSMSFSKPIFPTQTALPSYVLVSELVEIFNNNSINNFERPYPTAFTDITNTSGGVPAACCFEGAYASGGDINFISRTPTGGSSVVSIQKGTKVKVEYKGQGFPPPPQESAAPTKSYYTTVFSGGNAQEYGTYGAQDVIVFDVITPEPLIPNWNATGNTAAIDWFATGNSAYNLLAQYLYNNGYTSGPLYYEQIIQGYWGSMNDAHSSLGSVEKIAGIYSTDGLGIIVASVGGETNQFLTKNGLTKFIPRDKYFVFET